MKDFERQVELGLFFLGGGVCQPFFHLKFQFLQEKFCSLISWHYFTDKFQVTYMKMGSNKEVIRTKDVQNKVFIQGAFG